MSEGFPLLTTKKMAWKTMVTELLWFLRGDTNIKFLVDNGCNIWNGDAIKNYEKHNGEISWGPFITKEEAFVESMKNEEFAKKWGELGPIYGKQWRSWNTKQFESLNDGNFGHKYNDVSIDQIQNLINDLKTNPDSRRLMVNAWNVGELDQMILPPCHYGFQVYTRELSNKERIILMNKKLGVTDTLPQYYNTDGEMDKNNIPTRAISLMWNQRSVDTFLGLPFNIASYGLLLMMLANEVNMVPDELIGNLGDTHIYLNHIEQAKEQIGRDLTDEERYNKWFDNNYETGMERFFDPNNLPDFDNTYFEPTPKRTREPFELPKLKMNPIFLANLEHKGLDEAVNGQVNFELENYQSHPSIKAPLSN
jgi:thymidylate synthase